MWKTVVEVPEYDLFAISCTCIKLSVLTSGKGMKPGAKKAPRDVALRAQQEHPWHERCSDPWPGRVVAK